MPSVTVAIPTIPRRAALLSEALVSVSNQTRLPEAVSIAYDLKGVGAWSTRNSALMASHSTYTAFLDDDDILLPNHLQVLITCAMDTNADLVYPWFNGGEQQIVMPDGGNMVSPFGRYFGDEQRSWLLSTDNFIPITFLVRTELAKDVGGFPEPQHNNQYAAEDWEFLKNLLRADADFIHVGAITWNWRIHEGRTKGWQENSSS